MEHNEYIDRCIRKLENSLRGSALLLTMANNRMYTPEEKLCEMEAIEKLTQYVRNYYTNIELLEKCNVEQQKDIER